VKIGRRPTLALLASLLVFNLLLRYPRSEHEIGVDSFFIHALAGAILNDGHAEWILNPLSYFGWYPLSYPSAGPFYLASVGSLSGLNLEAAILVVSLMLGPAGILSAFVMAREFRDDNVLALFIALIYGLAPRFLSFTLWSASTRNLFMALLPILIWAVLRNYRRRSVPNAAVMAVCFMILAATHRLVILMLVVALAFLFAIIVQVALRILRIRAPKIFLRNSVRRASPHLALATVVVAVLAMLFGTNVLQEYSEGELATGPELHVQLLNLSVNIARTAGLALPLSLFGLVVISRQRNKTMREPFLVITLVALIPTFFLREYTGFYILPFLAIFGGLGAKGILNYLEIRPRAAGVAVLGLVVAIAGVSTAILNIEIGRSSTVTSETYTTGLYVKDLNAPGTMVANDGFMGIQVGALSGVRVLPVGGAGTTFQSPELLAYGFYTGNEVNEHVVQVAITDLTIESDSLWIATGIQAELDWVGIVQSLYGKVPDRLETRYQPTFYLELNIAEGRFLAYGNVYCSDLGISVHDQAYRIYDNGIQSLWWLHSPGITPQVSNALRRCP